MTPESFVPIRLLNSTLKNTLQAFRARRKGVLAPPPGSGGGAPGVLNEDNEHAALDLVIVLATR